MRKADYTHLADLIASELDAIDEHAPDSIAREVVERIARDFARQSHVNASAFLRACGID